MVSRRRFTQVLAGVVASFAAAGSAQAATTGPIAIAQAPNGVSYLGFESGSALQRIDASGATLSSIPLDQPSPVDGLAVDSSSNVWVSYANRVSQLSPTGAVLTTFAKTGPTCAPGQDPASTGGIAVSPTQVFVASRCENKLQVYTRSGTPVTSFGLPGAAYGRGVAWGQAQNGQPAKLYVGTKGRGTVAVYNAENLSDFVLPLKDLQVPTPSNAQGGPQVSGVAVDIYGQLLVLDSLNNAITIYDTNNDYSLYRTLGQPGGPSADLGKFNAPGAIAIHGQDGGDIAGNLFIADTGNNRVQRFNSYGYTFWATSTSGGTAPPQTAPTNITVPEITGTPQVGNTLTCSDGTWTGNPTSFNRGWNRDGSYLPGVGGTTYALTSADAGHTISCFVQAVNSVGPGGYATSQSVSVSAGGPSAPANTTPPSITGTAQVGSTLTCQPGTYSGTQPITVGYQFKRNGTVVGTASTYAVVAADVGQAITCTTTATNSAGSATATSAAVVPTAAPANGCTGRVGVSINAGAAFVNTTAVTLKIRPPAGATQVLISNDGGFDTVSTRALAGNCSYTYTLPSAASERLPKTVYVRFTGGSVDTDKTYTDDIILDTRPPALTAAKVSSGSAVASAAAVRSATLTLKAKDSGSGLKSVQYAGRKGAKGKTVAYKAKLKVKSVAVARWVRVFDKAGNPSKWKQVGRR